MTFSRESYKKTIDLIVRRQLPVLIHQYPEKEQKLLKQFYSVLQAYPAEIAEQRENFLDQVEIIKKKLFYSDKQVQNEYLQTPFLWTMHTFLNNCEGLLANSRFHADDYYRYLVHGLKGDYSKKGIISLLKNKLPLVDTRWEDLQYHLSPLNDPLTQEELQVLDTIYIAARSIDMMDREKLLRMIKSTIRPCIVKRLPNLFIRLGSRIGYSYDIGIYELTNLYMFLELKKEKGLQQIIEFFESNHGKTILALSSIFPIRNYPKMYFLWITTPKYIIEKVRNFIIEQEKERYKVHSSMILKQRKSFNKSLIQYQSNKGWKHHSLLGYDQLCKKLRRKNYKATDSIAEGVYLSVFKRSDWNYRQYTKPADLIKQFLTGLPSYSLKDLPWKDKKKPVHTQRINNIQRRMLVEMAHQGRILLNFSNWELFQQYSLDQYLLITPSLTTQQVESLAEYLPMFDIYETTEGKYLINGTMRHQMVNELRRELGWQGYEIMHYYWGMPKTLEMYDFEQMEWKIPRVLENYEKNSHLAE